MQIKIINLCFLLFFFSLIASCHSSGEVKMQEHIIVKESNKDSATIKIIDNPLYNFGMIQLGQKVTYAFHFINPGKTPLIISNVSATCGCTVAKYPKVPILSDKMDSITVFFDSNISGKGIQNKVITVFSNANNSPHLLTLVGNVK